MLEAHGAATISFNPFTAANTAKALRAILERERRHLPEADVQAIAEQANGDLHNAISTLQFVCTGAAAAPAPARAARPRARGAKRKAPAGGKEAAAAAATATAGGSAGAGGQASQVGYALRDSSLSLFHALGKLLYSKRLSPAAASQQPGSGSLPAASQAPAQPPQQAPQQTQQQQPQPLQQQAGSGQGSSTQPWTAHSFWQQAAAAATPPPRPAAAWAQRQPLDFDPEAVLAAAGLEAGVCTPALCVCVCGGGGGMQAPRLHHHGYA